MREVYGNLWNHRPDGCIVSARVITTNGAVKQDGRAVMGRGCAAEAKAMFPSIDRWLGDLLVKSGNHVYCGPLKPGERLLTMPVKHHWSQIADLALIERSAYELQVISRALDFQTVVLPRPGCGNGGLRWIEVKQVLRPLLDDRFHVITFELDPGENEPTWG